MKIGVLLDEPKIPAGFDYVFYEVKPSRGRILQPLQHAWNVINCFADNMVSQTRPDWVATSKGERAVRGTPKRFLWDWVCPSRIEYREYCKKIIRDVAQQNVAGVRLDSVCFPREGYCDCEVCIDSQQNSGRDWIKWRSHQIESFLQEVREFVPQNLGLTLEPYPCFGKDGFGLDLKLLSYVDFFSTPLYMDYSVVYWLDIIVNCLRRKVTKPYFIELYAGHPRAPTKHLVSALAVASRYADCAVLSTYEAGIAESLRREITEDSQVWKFFEEHGCKQMLEVLKSWRNSIQ